MDYITNFLVKTSLRTRRWHAFSVIFNPDFLHNELKNKNHSNPQTRHTKNFTEGYRPISLLSVLYKLLDRLILERIKDNVNAHIP